MNFELLSSSFKNIFILIFKFKSNFFRNMTFYIHFTLYTITKLNILKNFFWKVSNFSDLYWFFYVQKDIKTLNYLSK